MGISSLFSRTRKHPNIVRSGLTRRGFLMSGAAAAAAGAGALIHNPFMRVARADEPGSGRRFVSLYFSGAWDILLGPDARDPGQSYEAIDTGVDRLASPDKDPLPVMVGGQEVLWGAPMAGLVRHADVMTLFRGVNMNTVAHPTGKAYMHTMIPPAGVVARGDSLGTRFASAELYDDLLMPNFVIGMPTFNATMPAELTGITVDKALEIRDLVQRGGASGGDQTEALLRAAQDQTRGCVSEHYQGDIPEQLLGISRDRLRDMLDNSLASAFSYADDPDLLTRYGISNPNSSSDPAVIAATVWRLLETGMSRTVTAQLQSNLDTHGSNWASAQPARLRAGFDALASLLDDLRMEDPNLDSTTVVVYSEFSRTPRINGAGGRDHHFVNSTLVFGGGLRRGVCGASTEHSLGLLEIDIASGQPSEGGHVLTPEDIGATLAHAAGLDYAPFRVEPLTPWIA